MRFSCTGHEIRSCIKERAREEAEWKTKDAEAIYWSFFFFFCVRLVFGLRCQEFPESIFEQKNKRPFQHQIQCEWTTFIIQFYMSKLNILDNQIRSDQISRSVVSDSLRPHVSQHARPPCPSPTPKLGENGNTYNGNFMSCSVQFSHSVVSKSLWPHDHSTPGLPVHHQLPESTQTHVHWVGNAIQPSHPLSSPSSPAHNPRH